MIPRPVPTLIAALAIATGLTACGAAPATPAPATPAATPPVTGPATPAPTPSGPSPLPTPIVGEVDGDRDGPALSIEAVDSDTIAATLDDPEARAWRIVVAGVGDRGGDRWEIVVETGDVGPVITATEIRDGAIPDELDLTGFWDGTAAAGGCHSRLPVCLDSNGFELPDGDGRFSVRLDVSEPGHPLLVRGGTAAWVDEPFVLGPWHDTDPFPWGGA